MLQGVSEQQLLRHRGIRRRAARIQLALITRDAGSVSMNKPVLCSALMLLAAEAACQAQNDLTNADQPPSALASTAASGNFGIKVSGNRLVSTVDGGTVQLIGANISGLETGSASLWPQFASAGASFWSKVKNWGGQPINTVRLPLNEASWLNYTCYDPGAGASAGCYAAAKGAG
jgi:hypothetical protein